MESHTLFWILRLLIDPHKLMYRFNTISIKIPAGFMEEINRLILKCIKKCREPRRVKTFFFNLKN